MGVPRCTQVACNDLSRPLLPPRHVQIAIFDFLFANKNAKYTETNNLYCLNLVGYEIGLVHTQKVCKQNIHQK